MKKFKGIIPAFISGTIVVILISVLFAFTGCTADSTETSSENVEDVDVFKTIVDMETVAKSKESYWEVLNDKKTGILYMYNNGGYCTGITPLYHSDGSFKLYNEYFDENGRIKEDITEETNCYTEKREISE